jgi:hypothetical protein
VGVGEAGMRVWSLLTGALRATPSRTLASTLTVSPEGTLAATGGYDEAARLWDLRDGALVRALEGHTYGLAALAWTPDGAHLVAAGADQSLRVWCVDRTHRFAEEVLPAALAALEGELPGPDELAELWDEVRRCGYGRSLSEALGRDFARVRACVEALVPLGRAVVTTAR